MGKDGGDRGRLHTVKVTHSSRNGGVKGLMERIEKLSSQKVCVGVPKDAGESADPNYKGSIERKDAKDIDNADLVYIHTNGVRPTSMRHEMQKEIDKGTKYSIALQMYIHEHGSMTYRIPPRPIIEPAIEDSKEQLGEALGKAAQAAADGEDASIALENVGQKAENKVKNWFTNSKNGWAPNAKSTIEGWTSPWGKYFKGKGSDQPLIDTGALRQSITFTVREGDKDD